MEFEIWHIWVLASILFFALEIFIPSFIMASIALGCLAAFLGAIINVPMPIQIVLFIIGTTAGFLGVKPVMVNYAYRRKSIKTNANGLIGRIGKVNEEINNLLDKGCVAIDGDIWKSVSENGQIIAVGETVKVVDINSIVLTVKPQTENTEKIPSGESIHKSEKTKKLTVKIGSKKLFLSFDEIAFLFSTNKMTFLVTNEGKELIHDESLDRLNNALPDELFFRANRQFIVSRPIISEIKAGKNGKIQVFLKLTNGFPKYISISRLKAHTFREWLKYTEMTV